MPKLLNKFNLDGKVVIITGGAGLMGVNHAEVVIENGGIPILWDINEANLDTEINKLNNKYSLDCFGYLVDITSSKSINNAFNKIVDRFNAIDVLINNAANDPKPVQDDDNWSRFENFSEKNWEKDIAVGLTGAFLCSKIIGSYMAKSNNGVILNVASDLGIIAPDQRIYELPGKSSNEQPVKPVTYSVTKHALIGLTKYLATYWAENNIRVNCLSPGGIYNDQPQLFVSKLTNLIPMKRMANQDEYKSAVLFLISDASSYMTGSNLIIDGGRTCW